MVIAQHRMASVCEHLVGGAKKLSHRLNEIDFSSAVPWVYNPLEYAWEAHREYLCTYVKSPKIIFLGMNPGPWGMVQTGIPFGEISVVRDWLKIKNQARKPDRELVRRPIDGFRCQRCEVSGQRLWGLFQSRFGTPDAFFREHFVANYCPLAFMEESGRNVTPDKLPKDLRVPLEAACDQHLQQLVELLQPQWVVGVGGFAKNCIQRIVRESSKFQVGLVLHPSPASPAANRGWAEIATRQLMEQGIWK